MKEKSIGKITHCYFGFGGYQDVMIGFSFNFDTESGGVGDFWGTWNCEPDKHTKWTKDSQIRYLGESVLRASKVMADAKVSRFKDLVGKPVEVSWDGNALKEWRILTEVIL